MRKAMLVAMLVMFLLSQGCCSIFTGGPQVVSVESKPPGAKIKVGQYKGTSPYQLTLPRGKEYMITAEYGGKTQTQALHRSIEPVYWVNILLWPGLIIDFATGAMWKYNPIEYEFDFTE